MNFHPHNSFRNNQNTTSMESIDIITNIFGSFIKYEDRSDITLNIQRLPDLTRQNDTFLLLITPGDSRCCLIKIVELHENILFLLNKAI